MVEVLERELAVRHMPKKASEEDIKRRAFRRAKRQQPAREFGGNQFLCICREDLTKVPLPHSEYSSWAEMESGVDRKSPSLTLPKQWVGQDLDRNMARGWMETVR